MSDSGLKLEVWIFPGVWDLEFGVFPSVPEVGIAPTSPRLQRGANLPQLLGEAKTPSINLQTPEKVQYPSFKTSAAHITLLKFDAWYFSGLWSLGFRASEGGRPGR